MKNSDKYSFINNLLDKPNLNAHQEKKIIQLALKEIEKGSFIDKDLEKRVEKLEQKLSEKSSNMEGESNGSDGKGGKNHFINHDPETVYKVLQSFKIHDLKNLYAFKYLVHGLDLEDFDFQEYLKKSESDFKSLKNIPIVLYKNLEALIYSYKIFSDDIIKVHGCHPFEYNQKITIDEAYKEKLKHLFGGGNPYKKDHYNNFNTAIQRFKTKYRFDTTAGNSEASNLKTFLVNIFKYNTYTDENHVAHSFSKDRATDGTLFNENQFDFSELKEENFMVWNPPLKQFLKWIAYGILQHSNINGKRPFNSSEKKIVFRSYKSMSIRKNENDYIILEILDKDSQILKGKNNFIDFLNDEVKQLKSVCDLEVSFTANNNNHYKHFKASILPYKKHVQLPKGENGLLYKFKILEKLAYEKNITN
ncbi:hypothetical protein NMK71_04960 [Weeksellaceae bacterium KMM 9713]|uniref:Uncharacterized protein n=1 Tax=Profundicola chukchiensis TaxID=2961959 RepID=A0A9X4MVP3_9FLAO|nr:hypothetical protein [Profundicola chukchiensis]MDG4945756.1 hypothetical protein [Profundicola chukchiensis]